jgi:hypothetical protein
LTNYWGYNTIGFFAPHAAYSAAVRAANAIGERDHASRLSGAPTSRPRGAV